MNRKASADGRGHGLLDDVRLSCPGVLRRLHDRTLLDARDARRHADHHARLGESTLVDAVDEVAQHLLADLEVGDDAIFEGPNRLNVARGPPDHPLGLRSYCQRPTILDVHGDHRGLVQDDAATADIDQRVRRSEVDGHVSTQQEEAVVRH